MPQLARMLVAVLAVTLIGRDAATAADAPPGALSCGACHPARPGGLVPSLAGRPAPDIVEAMLAFRAGRGPVTLMDRIAKGFSEEEIGAIAAWYQRQASP
jgi:cytochrome subunit of sulfide dehydrogenase